jgi:N-acetylmuramoyl-L-alanine amidase
VSIHHNGAASASANGAEICVQINNATQQYDNKSLRLAQFMLAEFEKIGQSKRTSPIIRKANSTGSADYFGLLRTAAVYFIPAIITEFAFLSNPDDLKQVDTYTEQKIEADAIVRGILAYTG